ncbi:MAG: hypothetical protein PF795_10540 [Kiritimatiellae bacterium]|jgi:hypothetical protein|nr:hypothetical protein [Kiritimatiellia bacterium]
MNDDIIQEVWKAKDEIAAEHNYDVKCLVRSLRSKESDSGSRVVDVHAEQLSMVKECPPT